VAVVGNRSELEFVAARDTKKEIIVAKIFNPKNVRDEEEKYYIIFSRTSIITDGVDYQWQKKAQKSTPLVYFTKYGENFDAVDGRDVMSMGMEFPRERFGRVGEKTYCAMTANPYLSLSRAGY